MGRKEILIRLRDLSTEKPTTKMGQIRWAWPEVKAALHAGHTLQHVHKRLAEVGIEIGYRTLSLYIGRLERGEQLGPAHETAPQHAGKGATENSLSSAWKEVTGVASEAVKDPFANIRRERERKKIAG